MTCRRPDARRGRRTTPAGLLAGLLAAFVLAACAPPPPGQVASDEPRGGIGGTGITTGVLGTVTGFGSILVNGVRIETDGRSAGSPAGSVAESPLGPIALAEGQVVEALAAPGPEGPAARRVAVVWPLVGPVTAAARDGDLRVMGVPVRPVDGAILPPGGLAALSPGDRVAVSGLWRGGAVVASRLDRMTAGPDLAAGVLVPGADRSGSAGDASRVLGIGGTALAEPVPAGLSAAPAGGFWQVAGRWTGNGLSVESARPGRPLIEAGPLRQVSVEGYLTATQDGAWAVDGLGVPIDAAARVDPLAPGRAVFLGALDDQFRVAHGIPLPEAHDARVQALEAIGDGLAPSGDAVLETR